MSIPTPLDDGTILVTQYPGIATDGADCTAAVTLLLSELLASAGGVKGGGFSTYKLRIPAGAINASWDFNGMPEIGIIGAGLSRSRLFSSNGSPVISRQGNTVRVELSDFTVENSAGDGINLAGLESGYLKNLFFHCVRGLVMPRVSLTPGGSPIPNVDLQFEGMQFNNCTVGALLWARGSMRTIKCQRCLTGMDLAGSIDLNDGRFEECGTGLLTGSESSYEGSLSTITCEANLIHYHATKNAAHVVINQMSILGDLSNGQVATYGVQQDGGDVTYTGLSVNGRFTGTGVYVGAGASRATFVGGKNASGKQVLAPAGQVQFINSDI